MDMNEFRCFVEESGFDVWAWIDMSISLACEDYGEDMKERRDGILQKLYGSTAFPRCRACDGGDHDEPMKSKKVLEIARVNGGKTEFDDDDDDDGECKKKDEEESDDDDGECKKKEEEESDDDEQRKILEIKSLLVDYHKQQSESCLIGVLQKLADMNTSFKVLKETDIGRHVTKLRKHSSGEVRRLVKILVRKWKDTVDEWVRLNTPPQEATHSDTHHENGDAERTCVIINKHHLENDQETQYGEAKKSRNGPGSSFCNTIPITNNNNYGIVASIKSANVHAKYR